MKKIIICICLILVFVSSNVFAQQLGEKVYKDITALGQKYSKWFRVKEVAEYNEDGNKILERDYLGTETSYEYDGKNNLIHKKSISIVTKLPLAVEFWYEYDTAGNKTYQKINTGESIEEWWYQYDNRGNINYVRYKSGKDDIETWFDNDNYGNHIQANSSNNKTTIWQYEYDTSGKILYTLEVSGSLVWQNWYRYDANGNKIYEKNEYGQENWYDYNDKGNIIYEKSARRGSEEWYEYEYGNNGKVKKHIIYKSP